MKTIIQLAVLVFVQVCSAQEVKYAMRYDASPKTTFAVSTQEKTNRVSMGYDWPLDLGESKPVMKSWIDPFFYESEFITTVRGGAMVDRWGQDTYTFPPIKKWKGGFFTGKIDANYPLSHSYASRDWYDLSFVVSFTPKWLNRHNLR
jgi:hypothetical protein